MPQATVEIPAWFKNRPKAQKVTRRANDELVGLGLMKGTRAQKKRTTKPSILHEFDWRKAEYRSPKSQRTQTQRHSDAGAKNEKCRDEGERSYYEELRRDTTDSGPCCDV